MENSSGRGLPGYILLHSYVSLTNARFQVGVFVRGTVRPDDNSLSVLSSAENALSRVVRTVEKKKM